MNISRTSSLVLKARTYTHRVIRGQTHTRHFHGRMCPYFSIFFMFFLCLFQNRLFSMNITLQQKAQVALQKRQRSSTKTTNKRQKNGLSREIRAAKQRIKSAQHLHKNDKSEQAKKESENSIYVTALPSPFCTYTACHCAVFISLVYRMVSTVCLFYWPHCCLFFFYWNAVYESLLRRFLCGVWSERARASAFKRAPRS